MKKKKRSTASLKKYFSDVFRIIAISENRVVSRNEIEKGMIDNNICKKRLVTYILLEMVSKERLVRKKLKGQKQMGYVNNEEITKGKMNESYHSSGKIKKGNIKQTKLTQNELNNLIKKDMESYKKTIGNKKSEIHSDNMLFYVLHTTQITRCLSWITRLTLFIEGKVFSGKMNKINFARENIKLLEKFIGILCWNMKEKYPKGYNLFLKGMHDYLEFLDPFENTQYSRTTIEPSSLFR